MKPLIKRTKKNTILGLVVLYILFVTQLACGMGIALPHNPVDALATRVAVPTSNHQIDLSPSISEMRMLTLEFPTMIRAGDSDVVRLALEIDDSGSLTPMVEVDGNISEGKAINVPNLYETHNILAEARLDIAGMDVRPSGTVSEVLLPGQRVIFYWSVLPVEVGRYKGTVWFYLHFIPKTSGEESRMALSAQPIEIEATSFFGLRANSARWLGFSGAFISALLGFPFLETMLKVIWKRMHA